MRLSRRHYKSLKYKYSVWEYTVFFSENLKSLHVDNQGKHNMIDGGNVGIELECLVEIKLEYAAFKML